ncbi:MAG: hypothetical protein ACXVYM_00545 [Gaiellaceae bacterium]
MDLVARLSNGRKLVFGAGILLFIFTFFSWNSVTVGPFTASADAWATGRGKFMGWLLIILLIWEGALLAVSLGKLALPELPVQPILISLALGALVVLFGILRFFQGSSSRAWAAWFGLILIIALAAGLFLRWQEGEKVAKPAMAPPSPPPPAPPAGPME